MKLYWKEKNSGLDLIVLDDNDDEFIVGGVRLTKKGIEAMAKTQGYDPGRAIKGLTTVEEGKSFVEQFKPWIDFFGADIELNPEIH
ncbi:MAG: hypothetical protein CL506_01000 [Actinobacteria bacterium]|nr:hypothetical protein [Actinomycetota bacterium]